MLPRPSIRAVLVGAVCSAGCTEPTYYPGLPMGVPADTASEGVPCSAPTAGESTTLTIQSHLEVDVDLFWRDPTCVEYFYRSIAAGTTVEQGTRIGDAWVLRDAAAARVDQWLVTDPNPVWDVQP